MNDRAVAERAQRSARTAASWFVRAIAILRAATSSQNEHVRLLASYDAETLLRKVLYEGELLVALLSDDADFDQLRAYAKDVSEALRRRALAPKLSNTNGRTPDEAEAFLAKAAELRR